MFEGFEAASVDTGGSSVFLRRAGAGPPLLLLHGFPQTHLMWRDIAPRLARRFTVVCADLRGYGASGCPASAPDHAPYSKRAMAQEMVAVMERLGFPRFSAAGHDRGGRVVYRMALDHPARVERAAVLDVVPTADAWARADARFAAAFWPWSLLAQPAPLPERLLAAAPDAVVDAALGGWGSPPGTFAPAVRDAYVRALADPSRAHAVCEDYRAAAGCDREHDEADRASGRRIAAPLLVLWSGDGPLGAWYAEAGGPLGLWRAWADDAQGRACRGGHFFPEEHPAETASALDRFFGGGAPARPDAPAGGRDSGAPAG